MKTLSWSLAGSGLAGNKPSPGLWWVMWTTQPRAHIHFPHLSHKIQENSVRHFPKQLSDIWIIRRIYLEYDQSMLMVFVLVFILPARHTVLTVCSEDNTGLFTAIQPVLTHSSHIQSIRVISYFEWSLRRNLKSNQTIQQTRLSSDFLTAQGGEHSAGPE